MKKKIQSFFLFLFIGILCNAQKNDNVWVFGYWMPRCGLDFYFGSPDTVGFNTPFDFLGGSCISISDDQGNLQFYSNGNQVGNWNNQVVLQSYNFNNDTTGTSPPYNQYWQGIISVPYPDHPFEYALFHLCGVYIPNSGTFPIKLYHSKIDMSLNGGLGKMTLKKSIVYQDTLLPCVLQAVKHGNGRDWWIINHKAFSNCFYLSLLTPGGIVQNNLICTGPYLSFFTYGEGQSVFSPDGSLFAMAFNAYNKVYLFDFDRCSGIISIRDSVQIIPDDIDEWPVWGCSFSPGSRYLYATTNNDLYQYDTWSATLGSSQILIDHYDGFIDPFINYFYRHAMGPDGKIYMTSWNGSRYLHVINDPDAQDTLCDFVQHQLKLVSYHSSVLPEFPNYRLEKLPGSPCDTLVGTQENSRAENELKIYPDPNNGTFIISYSLAPNSKGKLVISDAIGKIVFEKTLPEWSIEQQINLEDIVPGVYHVKIENSHSYIFSRFIRM